jgi:hypothetical protein
MKLLLLALSLVCTLAHARDPKEVYAFRSAQPCPANGSKHGACPGYVVDHLRPLCSGGPDRPDNMAWSTLAFSRLKDREEDKLCASMRKSAIPTTSSNAALCLLSHRLVLPIIAANLCGGK